MNKLETALLDKKDEWDRIEAPAEMEERLKQALQGRRRKTRFRAIAVILIAVLLLTYSFDALAYYSRKFAGYDQVTKGSLKQLNEEGRGQHIGKSHTFSNGVEVTIDGIMFDENKLVAFYKVHCSSGKLQDILNYNLPTLHLYGLKPGGYYFSGGQGFIVDDKTMTFVDTLEPPQFYEKWMRFTVELIIDKKMEVGSINFTLDRNLAMKRTVRMDLHSEAGVGDYRILFDRLTASTMSSVIEGRIIPLTDSGLKAFKAETTEASVEIPHLRFDIMSDSGEVSQFSGGQSVSDNNVTFNSRNDALPENFKTLQIRNIRMDTMKLVDKTMDVSLDTRNLQVTDDLLVKRIYRDGADICVTAESCGVPLIALFEGDKQLEQVNSQEFDREAESAKPVERVYRFKVTGSNLKISIKYIRYSKYSADIINIPVG